MRSYALALMFAACAAQAGPAEPALTNRATDVLAQPQSDAAKLTSLADNDKVEVIKRSGAWSQVKTAAGQTGWVRMMHLKPANAAANSAKASANSNPLNALTSLVNSGRTSNNATDTTGVKGLQAEDLQRARPNPDEFRKMQKYTASRDAGQAFARTSKLQPAQVEYLKDSGAPASGGGNNNSNDGAAPGMMGV